MACLSLALYVHSIAGHILKKKPKQAPTKAKQPMHQSTTLKENAKKPQKQLLKLSNQQQQRS